MVECKSLARSRIGTGGGVDFKDAETGKESLLRNSPPAGGAGTADKTCGVFSQSGHGCGVRRAHPEDGRGSHHLYNPSVIQIWLRSF